MKISTILIALLVTFPQICLSEDYEKNIEKWIEVKRPPKSERVDRALWSLRANYSKHDWIVKLNGSRVEPCLKEEETPERLRPNFECKVDKFSGGKEAFCKVDNGWLVGFNKGEWGGALYWFSTNGEEHKIISNHWIVDFFTIKKRRLAVEGLAHLTRSRGSIIEIQYDKKENAWKALSLVKLPEAPRALAIMANGEIILALSASLARWSEKSGLKILAEDVFPYVIPNSVAISKDETNVYIGMRQYIGEYNFKTGKFRYLIPNEKYKNYLPKEEEDRMRKQYGSSGRKNTGPKEQENRIRKQYGGTDPRNTGLEVVE